jgi:hypothetical protein
VESANFIGAFGLSDVYYNVYIQDDDDHHMRVLVRHVEMHCCSSYRCLFGILVHAVHESHTK